MQIHSIISNTISEEVLHSGHLSIRYMTDGFSLLLEDWQYKPVILNRFSSDLPLSLPGYILECEEWLNKHTLLENFSGEVTVIIDSASATLVPDELFSEEYAHAYLEQNGYNIIHHDAMWGKIKNRPFYLLYLVPKPVSEHAEKFRGNKRVYHTGKCVFSVSDQVNASDHQRGFSYLELQSNYLEILYIKNDELRFSNRMPLKNTRDFLYHTLNTLHRTGFDMKHMPLYYSGILSGSQDLLDTLQRYIQHLEPLPYFIQDLDKSAIPEHTILAEATRCE